MDLTTATPVEIDTALAEIYTRYYTQAGETARFLKYINEYKQGLARKEAGDHSYAHWAARDLTDLEAKYEASREAQQAILAETLPYESEYRSRPWTRFFLVKNSGGHIHSSMDCSTCFPTTQFGWLPELSGQSEPEAVAAHGAILCTVCYPTAPVEWTDRRDDSVCTGSGRYYNADLPHRTGFYAGNWGTCEACGETQTVSKYGKIRKHKA